jgi:hypothetical protein
VTAPRAGGNAGGGASADARGLESALQASGVPCAVEARAALAVIVTSAAGVARLTSDEHRQTALTLARRHGFTHAAVELWEQPTGADAALLRH